MPEPDGSLPVEPSEAAILLSDPRVNQEGGECYASQGPQLSACPPFGTGVNSPS
jgi:hypothetical protein